MSIESELSEGPAFPVGTIRYWYQDGGRFYLFSEPGFGNSGAGEHCTVDYPFRVMDFDTVAATHARDWFIEVWCPLNNCATIYIG